MAQKPLTKTQAKAAFLAQANHFTRLGTPNSDHSKLLLNSLAALFAAYTCEDIQVKFGWHDVPPVLAVTRPRPTEQQWGINWPEEPNSYRYFAVKSEWEACCFAHLVRKWLEREFANAKYHYETYPVLWESDFGDHAENLAEHYDSLKAEIDHMAEIFEYKKIGYADKDLKFYSFGEQFKELTRCVKNGERKALYPVFAHIIKSGEHGLETPTLRTLRDDIDQLLSDVAVDVAVENTPVYDRPEPIESLCLSIRAESALVAAGIKSIPALLEKTESELLKLEGFGKKSLADVKTNLEQRGLTLGSAK